MHYFKMAAATDELILLERVFLRLGSAETDEQLQASVCKFLPPVLLKLSSPQEGVRKKVMELLIHINRRVKSRSQVELPVEALLLQYQDPAASSFVINFTIIYIKLGYGRMPMRKQVELIPSILNAIEGKPLSHQDSLMLLIMPALGSVVIPIDERASLFGLQDKPYVAKQLINFMLDVLLLPYSYVGRLVYGEGQAIDWSQSTVPPGMSEYAFKRVIGESPPSTEDLEKMKMSIIRILAAGCFPESDILIHLIVAAADTTCAVACMGDIELKKIVSTVDWSSLQLAAPLYTLFLGTDALATQKEVKPEMKRLPACTRIRLKLLYYLCRVTKAGFIIPPCIQVVFDSLYGKSTNPKLKSLALQFTSNIVQQCNLAPLVRVAGVILNGMIKLISVGDDIHKPMAYTVIGQLGQRIPSLINKDLNLLRNFFDALLSMDGDLQRSARDALISVSSAFILSKEDETNIALMNAFLSAHIESEQSSVRFVAMHYAATVLPPDDPRSRYLLLLASGDNMQNISSEAVKALYGVVRKGEDDKQEEKQMLLPDFQKLVTYIYTKMQARMSSPGKVNVGSKTLPYTVAMLSEIINYLRVCLARSANIPIHSEPLQHPCEHTPLIGRYLENLYKSESGILNNYLDIILLLCHVSADQSSLRALLEVIGSVPQYITKLYEKELPWLHTLIGSTNLEIRILAAKNYGIITGCSSTIDFEKHVSDMINMVNSKNLESQHGALLALTYMMERKLAFRRKENHDDLLNWETYVTVVKTICTFLGNSRLLLMDAAIQGIGLLGKTFGLPLPAEGSSTPNKKEIVDALFAAHNSPLMCTKIREKAVVSLGYLCVGEIFPHASLIVDTFISTVKEKRDLEVNLTIGEALVCCVQGQASAEGRDAWTTLPNEHNVSYTTESTELLKRTIYELKRISNELDKPALRQAVCVWLVTLLKDNINRSCVKKQLFGIHVTLIGFLWDTCDIVQDFAAKGLGLVYVNSNEKDRDALVSSTLELIERGPKGLLDAQWLKYREIRSLAIELHKPELVYYLMHFVHHNAVWTSKKGAAFDFAAIANVLSDELNKYLPNIVPKLYRYKFDPTREIQQYMINIWRALVPSTSKAIEQYHKEMLDDISEKLNKPEWRVRISCCFALSDLLRTNIHINLAESAPDLWRKLFRVMDDMHESVRLAATSASKTLSKTCIRYCDPSHGKNADEVLQAILPVLLDIGVVHTLDTVRAVSLQTVSQLVPIAGNLPKPSLVTLILALLASIGESENPELSYLSTAFGQVTETQDAIDNIRATAAKGHYATESIKKCIQYIDASTLKELMPKVIELIKCSVGFGTKIACTHFLILLSTQLNQELQPYSKKILRVLYYGLSDRNAAVRKHNATAIGHMVGSSTESSVKKLINALNTSYHETEEAPMRFAIGHTIQAINNHNQEIIRAYSSIVLPLTFFAMHVDKVYGNRSLIELWTELWNEISPGTETGIRQNLGAITDMLCTALNSASWTTKVQAANAVCTVAHKLDPNIDAEARKTLLNGLIDALRGRSWNYKERLLDALVALACNSKSALQDDDKLLSDIVETLHRESKKNTTFYRRHAFKAFATVLHEFDIDKFEDVYSIALDMLPKHSDKLSPDEDESEPGSEQKRLNTGKVQETVYEALGMAWPSSKETQDKFCIEFVTHCHKTLLDNRASIQIVILVALNLFVDKLILFQIDSTKLSETDRQTMESICETLHKILRYCIGIRYYTVVQEKALNIALSLSKQMRETKNDEQLSKLASLFKDLLPDLAKDYKPEFGNRIIAIKAFLEM